MVLALKTIPYHLLKHDGNNLQVPALLLKGLQCIKCKHVRMQNRQDELSTNLWLCFHTFSNFGVTGKRISFCFCNRPNGIFSSKTFEVFQHEDESARCNPKSTKFYVMGGLPHQHVHWVQDIRLGWCHQTMEPWFELSILFWFPNPQLTLT